MESGRIKLYDFSHLAQTPTYVLRNVQRWLVRRVAEANAKKDAADIARWKESFKKLEEELGARE